MPNKKTLKINWIDFGKHHNAREDYFYRLLSGFYNLELSDRPDYVFYGPFGNRHHQYKDCIKIYHTGENVVPNFNYCDYALAYAYMQFADRYFRFPLWKIYTSDLELARQKGQNMTNEQYLNRSFCAFVVSQSKRTDGKREAFFEALSKSYKQVASGGRYKNNVGGPVEDKIAFQKQYKFSLCFENIFQEGYTTEKILQGFASDTVPIYYGNPQVCTDFNEDAFINAHNFATEDELIEYIKKVDNDDALYLKMIKAPIFKPEQEPNDENLIKFLTNIFEQDKQAAKRTHFVKPYIDINSQDVKGALVWELVKAWFWRHLPWNKRKAIDQYCLAEKKAK